MVAELPGREGWEVEEEEEEEERRRDLRLSHLIFSIDPEGCEDVDDTLSIRYVLLSAPHKHSRIVTFWYLQTFSQSCM